MKYLIVFLIVLTISFAQESPIIGVQPKAINFEFVDGQKPEWEDFKDQVVLIDFWATWCTPCIKSFPHMNKLVETFKDEPVRFISLTYEPRKLINKFLEKYELNTELAFDNDFATFRSLNGWAIPNILMINRDGKIVGRTHPEYLTEEVINQVLAGEIPDVKQTPEDQFVPAESEKYFRSTIDMQMKKFGLSDK